jgi:hypothetical protein
MGSQRDVTAKLRRLAVALYAYVDVAELDLRLSRLQEKGVVERVPTRWQLVIGSIDMLRFWIAPAAGAYYQERDTSFAFYQWLRFVEEPASVVDPVGLFTSQDGIIAHMMQVAHDNPQYDLELLQMFDDGVSELEKQLDDMLVGTHPRAATIRAIIEEPDYHARLRDYVARWRRDQTSRFHPDRTPSDVELTFGSLVGAMRYCNGLPRGALGAMKHLLTVRKFSPRNAQ